MEAVKRMAGHLKAVLLVCLPGTRHHKVYTALARGRVLYAIGGHIQVCRVCWQWEDSQERAGAFYWLPADNADQLEAQARAHLALIGRQMEEGQFIVCPRQLAKLARWEEPAEGKA